MTIIVPFDDRMDVEALGAIRSKSPFYYVPDKLDKTLFYKWNRKELPHAIEGENRDYGKNWLYVDLVPSTCWYNNVRAIIDDVDWERIKIMCKKRAGFKCEACGAPADYHAKNYLECHERYEYNLDDCTQKLIRFMCLCTRCHQATHFGLAEVYGNREKAKNHLMSVNNWTSKRTESHIAKRFAQWEYKSEIDWKADMKLLQAMGVNIINQHETEQNMLFEGGNEPKYRKEHLFYGYTLREIKEKLEKLYSRAIP